MNMPKFGIGKQIFAQLGVTAVNAAVSYGLKKVGAVEDPGLAFMLGTGIQVVGSSAIQCLGAWRNPDGSPATQPYYPRDRR